MTETELKQQLGLWFHQGNQAALARAFKHLTARLRLPLALRRCISDAVAEELRQEVLLKLLDGAQGKLRDKDRPFAYARESLYNAALDFLKKQDRRRKLDQKYEPGAAAPTDGLVLDGQSELARAVDALSAIDDSLDLDDRMAVLLTIAPDRITDDEWRLLASRHGAAPLDRPMAPLDRKAASRLLYPPQPGESDDARVERFRKRLERACRWVLRAIEEDHP